MSDVYFGATVADSTTWVSETEIKTDVPRSDSAEVVHIALNWDGYWISEHTQEFTYSDAT